MWVCQCPRLLSAALHPYLHSVTEVSPGSRSHHGQQACARADVQDDDLLATGLHSGHRCSDALIVLFILTTAKKTKQDMKMFLQNTLENSTPANTLRTLLLWSSPTLTLSWS